MTGFRIKNVLMIHWNLAIWKQFDCYKQHTEVDKMYYAYLCRTKTHILYTQTIFLPATSMKKNTALNPL